MILDLTEEQREYLLPILLEKQENEINRPDIDVDKLELIEELIEKIEIDIYGEPDRGRSAVFASSRIMHSTGSVSAKFYNP